MRNGLVVCLFVLAAGLLLDGDLAAGSLEPPGPPAPTMKTLQQVESRTPITSLPFTITQPGSYYLTGNLTGVAGSDGIHVNAISVTIDLNGFTLTGAGSFTGISGGSGGSKQIVIRNGMVRGWGRGIDTQFAPGSLIENVVVDGNVSGGIVAGQNNIIRDSIAAANGDWGILALQGSTIDRCTAASNPQAGFAAVSTTLTRSTATNNGLTGFSVDVGSVASECTAFGNSTGFLLGTGARVSRSTARQNGIGFSSGGGHGASIEECTAETNSDDGIIVGSEALVRGSVAHGNTNDGIQTTGSGSRIEDNESMHNNTGFRIGGTQNMVVKNRSYTNVISYSTAVNNKVGTITGDPTTANPWANFQ